MINTIATIIGTGIAVGSATGVVLSGFYKTNKEADIDHQTMEKKFDNKLERLETRLQHEIELGNKDVKSEFKTIADKIDEMKTRYVTNENFKTYVPKWIQCILIGIIVFAAMIIFDKNLLPSNNLNKQFVTYVISN